MSYSAVLLPTLHKLLQGLGLLLGCWACASWDAGCLLGARGDNGDGDDDDDDDTGGGGHGDDDDDDDEGLPAYSHHDKMPPWWGNVSNDKGGNVSVSNSHHT